MTSKQSHTELIAQWLMLLATGMVRSTY